MAQEADNAADPCAVALGYHALPALRDQFPAQPPLLVGRLELRGVVAPKCSAMMDDVVPVPDVDDGRSKASQTACYPSEPGRGVTDRAMKERLAQADDEIANQQPGKNMCSRRHRISPL